MFRVTVDDDAHTSSASTSNSTHEKSYHYSVVTVTDLPSYRRRHASESFNAHHDAVAHETTRDDAVDAHTTPERVTFHRRRRYTDFKRLHDALTDPRGRYQARLPSMPKKALVNTVAVVETRRETFRYVMDAVGRDYALRESEEVIDFLTRADEGGGGGSGGVNASTASGRDGVADWTKRRAEDEDDKEDASRTREEAEEEDAPLPPRDGRGLESLLASTMRVHGAKTVAGSSALDARRDDENENADETTTTAATTTTESDGRPVVVAFASTSSPSMAMSSLKPSTSTTYERTTAGAREAVKANDAAALDAVLRSGRVDVNGKDSSGMTLLHLACLFHRTSAVEVLLDRGADPEIRNAQGETATEVASTTTRVFVERMLKKIHKK